MHIRPYCSDDLETLRQIMVEAFDGVSIDQGMEREFGLINDHDWQWRKGKHLDSDVSRNPEGIFVIELDGKTVGFISTWIDQEAGIGHIPNLVFVPECRGKGLGRKAIQYALDHFRESGLTHTKIETLVQNDAGNHLYTSMGFREVARQIHFAGNLEEMQKISDERTSGQ